MLSFLYYLLFLFLVLHAKISGVFLCNMLRNILVHIFLQCLERPTKTKCIKKRSAQNCINYKIKSLIEKKYWLKEKRFIEKKKNCIERDDLYLRGWSNLKEKASDERA